MVKMMSPSLKRHAVKEKEKEDAALAREVSAWIVKHPMLWLIHSLINHDEIKSAFLRYDDLPGGCMAVENCSTLEAQLDSVWNMMEEKWNDLYLPATSAKPDLHSDFANFIAVSYDL